MTNIGVSSLDGADWHDLLGTGGDVLLAGFLGQEEAGRFDDEIGADLVPLEFGRVLVGGQADLLAVDDQVLPSTEMSPLKLPWTESYFSM